MARTIMAVRREASHMITYARSEAARMITAERNVDRTPIESDFADDDVDIPEETVSCSGFSLSDIEGSIRIDATKTNK